MKHAQKLFAFHYSGLNMFEATLSQMPPEKSHCSWKISSLMSLYLDQFLYNASDQFPPHWQKSFQSNNFSFELPSPPRLPPYDKKHVFIKAKPEFWLIALSSESDVAGPLWPPLRDLSPTLIRLGVPNHRKR